LEEAEALPRPADQAIRNVALGLACYRVAFDERHPDLAPVTTEKAPERYAECLRAQVPQANVDHRAGAANDAVVLYRQRCPAQVRQPLSMIGSLHADQARSQEIGNRHIDRRTARVPQTIGDETAAGGD